MADENSKPDGPAPGAEADIPEIEAEIVVEGEASAQEGAFKDNVDDDAAKPDDKSPPKRMPFTPGVILFFAFAALALIVLAVWRFQGSGNTQVNNTTPQQEEALSAPGNIDGQETAVAETGPDIENSGAAATQGAAENPTEEASSAANESAVDAGSEDPESNDPGKIANNQFADLKGELNDASPAPDISGGQGEIFLPPLNTEKIAPQTNQTLQDEAKGLSPSTVTTPPPSDNSAVDSAPSQPAFEIEEGNREGPGPEQSDADRQTSAVASDVSELDPSKEGAAAAESENAIALAAADENAKLRNDLASLKQEFDVEKARMAQALEEERRRSALQQEELATLRREYQAALDVQNEEENAELLELRARLDKIRNDEITPIARRVAAAAALKSLESAFNEGRAFLIELEKFEQTMPGAPATSVLRKHAETGIVPTQQLKDRFSAAAGAALAAARKEQAEGLGGALIAQAQNIITIRPAKPQAGDGPAAVISRAEFAVKEGDLEGALAELAGLPAAGRDAMAPWIDDTKSRIDAASAMSELNNLIFGALSQ